MDKIITPFVKWAGGKRQLLSQISDRLPKNYNRYLEPFVGGGAVLFHLQPQVAIINDSNKSLINVYQCIKNDALELIAIINELDKKIIEGGKSFYYEIRDVYNDKLHEDEYDIELASIFIFLNKHCFNGLYRVNKKGLFNVPYNNSVSKSIDVDNIYAISEYIQNIEICNTDFEEICDRAEKYDFVFLDSPYAPLKEDSFEAYTKEGFSKDEHIRLAKIYEILTNRGCYCMLTNHNTELIRELYSAYRIDNIVVKRMINSDASKRVGEEVIVINY